MKKKTRVGHAFFSKEHNVLHSFAFFWLGRIQKSFGKQQSMIVEKEVRVINKLHVEPFAECDISNRVHTRISTLYMSRKITKR